MPACAGHAIEALGRFSRRDPTPGPHRRGRRRRVYDDFAHHPTAIRTTLQGLRRRVGSDEIVAVIEPRSHTMSLGTLRHDLTTCCAPADQAFWFRGDNIKWDLAEVVNRASFRRAVRRSRPADRRLARCRPSAGTSSS
jgi:UDP-N-acetylmuramate: L-alanyl-gamma-D-glutamyl-meso-diaminopimelate ligase